MKKALVVLLAVVSLFSLSGCVTNPTQGLGSGFGGFSGGYSNVTGPNTGVDHSGYEARRRQKVEVGVVVDMREVNLTSRRTGNTADYMGAAIGGALGVAAGNSVDGGSARQIARLVLGAVGAWGGSQIAGKLDTREEIGLEIVVRLENGQMTSVVQAIDAQSAKLQLGDSVRLSEGQLVRVAAHRDGSATRTAGRQMQPSGGKLDLKAIFN